KIATLMNGNSTTRTMQSAYTRPAVGEALAGQSGRLSNIVLVARRFCSAGLWPAVRRASLVRRYTGNCRSDPIRIITAIKVPCDFVAPASGRLSGGRLSPAATLLTADQIPSGSSLL